MKHWILLLGALGGGLALAARPAFDQKGFLEGVKRAASARTVKASASGAALLKLLPKSCAGKPMVDPLISQNTGGKGQAPTSVYAQYGMLSVQIADLSNQSYANRVGLARDNLAAFDPRKAYALSLKNALGYGRVDAEQQVAQLGVWVDGRFSLTLTQNNARSSDALEKCLGQMDLSALGKL